MSRNFIGFAAGALTLALLSGCGALTREAPGPCPPIVAVDDASSMTRFTPGGTDLTDVLFEVGVDDVRYGCEYDGKQAINLDATVVLIGSRGPANTTGTADFSYFIAVATTDRQILARQDFPVSIPFRGNLTRVRLTDSVQMRIPLQEGQTGANYRIFIGLDITEEELSYNRRRQ